MSDESLRLPAYTVHIDPTDCDVLGHVNHARYLVFFERARWAVVKKVFPGAKLQRGVRFAVVRHVDISYLAEAVPEDDIVITSGLERLGTTSFTIRQQARKSGDTLVCEARVTLVSVEGGKAAPVPDEWRELFPRWPESAA